LIFIKTKTYITLLLILFITAQASIAQDFTYEIDANEPLIISYGSCNKQDKPQPLWKDIIAEGSDIFIFLGDNIYGDTQNMDLLEEKYELQASQEDYQKLSQNSTIIGTWDDHDYGKNDAGKEFIKKEESQKLFLDFFGISPDSPLRKRKGVNSSHLVSWGNKTVKIILLDTRYHRSTLERQNRVYKPNTEGTMLGEDQWIWLENQLKNSNADFTIIGSSIQVIAEDHPYEKWANFPNERQKLIDLIVKHKPKGLVMLSGDRHISEISSMEVLGIDYPLVDITSSGLTHTWSGASPEEYNRHREGELHAKLSYSILKFDLDKNQVMEVTAFIKTHNQKVLAKKTLK